MYSSFNDDSQPDHHGHRLPQLRHVDIPLRHSLLGKLIATVTKESLLCHSGEVLQGNLKPNECPGFGKECTPRHPLGATMVSSEGACAAYYNYGRFVAVESIH